MPNTETFAAVTTDSGLVSAILHVSPVFIRCGANRRGRFADRRATRAERTAARQERRAVVIAAAIDFGRAGETSY